MWITTRRSRRFQLAVSRPFGIYQPDSKAVIIGVGSILIGVGQTPDGSVRHDSQ